MTRPERKKEIERIRQEGYDAAKAGRHINTVPREYLYNMNRYHWEAGHRSYEGDDCDESC